MVGIRQCHFLKASTPSSPFRFFSGPISLGFHDVLVLSIKRLGRSFICPEGSPVLCRKSYTTLRSMGERSEVSGVFQMDALKQIHR